MGYNTDFYGEFRVEPPLNLAEVTYLKEFSNTRRMKRISGPYTIEDPDDNMGQSHTADVIAYNSPPDGQPGLWCKWEPTDDGKYITWNQWEKFYDAAEWMGYLIEHFLKEGCLAKKAEPEKFKDFVPHVVNGIVDAEGEDSGDIWRIIIKDNKVLKSFATIEFHDEEPVVIPDS